jgi:subtilisin family serine protease
MRGRGVAVGLVLALVVPVAFQAPAVADPTAPQAGGSGVAGASDADGAASTVTLITGDRVTVSTLADGHRTYSVRAARRSGGTPVSYDSYTAADGLHVVPSDARAYLAAGVLDTDLFNLDLLVREGRTDAVAASPIIVGFGGGLAADALSQQASALPGSRLTATLASIDAVAVRVEPTTPQDFGDFWRALTNVPPSGARRMTHGVAKIWLDRQVHVDLDQSVPQIGAPTVWKAGFNGRGVSVAVLDTGVDATHPDFAGRIVDTANFTTEASVVDRHGHGTHVASIVAGSGTASAGRYTGVAPGASLLIGKVLDKNGVGDLSQAIQGMEWAAHHGARVINLSLGAGASDGSDPGSQAINALTAETGALFVVAAGNDGGVAAINAPGAADAALTVGAVSKTEVLADFSSRGPRFGDGAVKPEITGPGVDVVAARAAGTTLGTPVDRRYTRLSGTSMATPHVSGAAALLAQQHPEWTAERLKSALVSTARPGAYSPFEQGAGRVDVARAFAQHVYGPGAVSFGVLTTAQRRDLVYRNDTAAPVSLTLSLTARAWDGQPAPPGEFGLDAGTVWVPAGGTASVGLAADPSVSAHRGVDSAVVTAASADGRVVVRTPLSLYEPPVTQALNVHGLDRLGRPADDGLPTWVYKLDGPVPNDPFAPLVQVAFLSGGQSTVQVSPGVYDVYAQISEYDVDRMRSSMVGLTELNVRDDRSVVLDARTAVRILPTPPDGVETLMAIFGFSHGLPDGSVVGAHAAFGLGFQNWEFYRSPSPAVKVGWFDADDQWVLGTRLITVDARGGPRLDLTPAYVYYLAAPAFEGIRTAEVVSVGEGEQGDLDRVGVRGKLALARIPIPDTEFPRVNYAFGKAQEITERAAAAGATGVLFYVDIPGALGLELASTPILQLGLPYDQGVSLERELAHAQVQLTLSGRRTPTDIYRLRFVRASGGPSTDPPTPDWGRLKTMRTQLHGDVANLTYHTAWHVFDSHNPTSAMLLVPIWGPAAVTEHVAEIGPDLLFARQVIQSPNNVELPTVSNFLSRDLITPSSPETEKWFQSPLSRGQFDGPHPYPFTLRCGLCLDGDRFVVDLHNLDSDPRHYAIAQADDSEFALFRGQARIPLRGTTTPYFTLPDTRSVYRLRQVDRQPLDKTVRVFAPRTTTNWTFHAVPVPAGTRPPNFSCPFSGSAGSCGFQPLLTLRYDLGLDLRNRAPAGGELDVNVFVAAHQGALGQGSIAGLRVWTSADRGAHWQDAGVTSRGNGNFSVTVKNPKRSNSPIWLRMEAWDSKGNLVEQTIEGAYGLTP